MADLLSTTSAVRIMGVWVRRADALLGAGALANAADAVAAQRERWAPVDGLDALGSRDARTDRSDVG